MMWWTLWNAFIVTCLPTYLLIAIGGCRPTSGCSGFSSPTVSIPLNKTKLLGDECKFVIKFFSFQRCYAGATIAWGVYWSDWSGMYAKITAAQKYLSAVLTLQIQDVLLETYYWTRSATENLTHLGCRGSAPVTTVCLVVDRWLFSLTLDVRQTIAISLRG